MALAAALCLASGYLIVALGLPRYASFGWLLRLSLAAGFGLGIFSADYLIGLAVGIYRPWLIDLLMFVVLLIAYFLIRPFKSASEITAARIQWQEQTLTRRILAVAFAIALCAAIYSAILRCLVHPYGDGWDAFSIWNLHARFLFRGGVAWREGFSPLIPWSHPDYPILLPAAIAHFWSYLGHESQSIPAVIGLIFTFSTVGLLFSSLAVLRDRTSALLGSLVLLATPFFTELGTSQYADVPLAFFFLAAISLFCIYSQTSRNSVSSDRGRLLVLSGLSASFAAWTKNEGVLFVFAFLLSGMWWVSIHRQIRETHEGRISEFSGRNVRILALLLSGMAPILLLIFWFKHSIAPRGDLFPDAMIALHKLLDPARYWAVLKWYVKGVFRFGDWRFAPGPLVLAAFYFLAERPSGSCRDTGFRVGALTLALTLAGYFMIYLITPYDIYWHLHNSLSRLLLQLWPSVIFLFFLAVSPPVQKIAHSANVPK